MESKILFSEKQRFTQWWLWLLLLGINAIFIFQAYQFLVLHKPLGVHANSTMGFLFGFCIIIIITILLRIISLKTIIKEDGIYIKFFPFHLKFKKYPFDTIEQVYIRKYNPIFEYGGWGLRYSFKNGKAFNISGNMGIQIIFKNHSKLLIGTKKNHLVEKILNDILVN